MRPSVTRPKLLLAILAFLVAIFACTALLRAQNLSQKHEPYTRQQHGCSFFDLQSFSCSLFCQ